MTREDTVWLVKNIFGEEASKDNDIVQFYMDVNETAMDEYAKKESIAFKKFWDNFNPPIGKFPNDEELYTLYLKYKNK